MQKKEKEGSGWKEGRKNIEEREGRGYDRRKEEY